MNILGISAYYHDSAACLVQDGQIVAAAQEERFTRKKHDHRFPTKAVEYCLQQGGGLEVSNLDYVAFYDKPFLKFERLLQTYLAYAPRGFGQFIRGMPLWLKEKLWMKEHLKRTLEFEGTILFPEHHESHAASAFYPSPFEKAAFLTLDGVGEWATASFGVGSGKDLTIKADLKFPHSLGLLYSAFTYYLGFKVNSGEYKVMGLAPYGEPKYVDAILDNLIDLKSDGSFRMDMQYFNYCTGLTMTNEKFANLFGQPRRTPESKLEQFHMDVARSVQEVTELVMLKMASHVHHVTRMENLVLAGGVALNCVGNGRILREGPFKNIWIQPAAGDAGGALGAAFFTWHQYLGNERKASGTRDRQAGSYLGPSYSEEEIEQFLRERAIPYKKVSRTQLPSEVAALVAEEKVIGWFSGRMEFGPRALGARSIIGDARSQKMQTTMNLKIKFRESFRPFAPSVLKEKAADYFELNAESPYMLLVAPVKSDKCFNQGTNGVHGFERLKQKRSEIQAVTHVDYSARVQTVEADTNSPYYEVIKAFYERTNCPVIVNTSFNVRGEPIVCTPDDAYRCFMRTNMDYLVIENFILDKTEQPKIVQDDSWQQEFELD